MKHLWALALLAFFCTGLYAQDFVGYVRRVDSVSSPVNAAKVELFVDGALVKTIKTFSNGSFSFTPAKTTTYRVKISYFGYADTTYTISTDANGKPYPGSVTVKLKKDGIRLFGVIKNIDDGKPIRNAGVVLRNIGTRSEVRINTGPDGIYGFKLDYESNYRLIIDKRSPGIQNRFRDTALYISTIGFYVPFDFEMDINLEQPTGTVVFNDGSDEGRVAVNKAPSSAVASTAGKKARVKETQPKASEANVVVIRDVVDKKQAGKAPTPAATKPGETAGPDMAEMRERADEDSLIKSIIAFARKQAVQDSIMLAKEERENEAREIAAEKIADSVSRLNAQREKQHIEDSITHAKIEQQRLAKEAAAKKAHQDSVINLALAARKKFVADSIARVAITAKKRASEDSIAHERAELKKMEMQLATRRAYLDSVDNALKIARKKEIQDSIAAVVAARKQAELDSVNHARQLAVQKAHADSIAKAALALKKKLEQDSIAKVQAARKRFVEDSINKAKTLALQKAYADSVAKAATALKKKLEQDSIAKVQAARKHFVEDSIAKVQAARKRFVEDSIAKERSLAAVRAHNDSIMKVQQAIKRKQEQDSIARVQAAIKKHQQDSIDRAKQLAAQKLIADSIERVNKIIEKKKAEERAARPVLDTAEMNRIEQQRRKAEAMRTADSVAKAYWKARNYTDSITKALNAMKAALAKAEEEKAAMKKQLEQRNMRDKAVADSIRLLVGIPVKPKAPAPRPMSEDDEWRRILDELAAQKRFEDTLAHFQNISLKKAKANKPIPETKP